tara:strand:+ start:633 stop:926 length:294 start_codon:yes stop_codon:yes gene_type:complete
MNYQQSANPSATNSELDAKVIVTPNKLSPKQLDALKSAYVERIVDNMDIKTMEQYVFDDMTDYVDKLSDSEVIEECNNYFDDRLEDIIEEIKECVPE